MKKTLLRLRIHKIKTTPPFNKWKFIFDYSVRTLYGGLVHRKKKVELYSSFICLQFGSQVILN